MYYTINSKYTNYLAHHGIKGQKWGIRKYQNEDGSLTAEGKKRYAGDKGILRRWNDANLAARLHGMTYRERNKAEAQKLWSGNLSNKKEYGKEMALTRKEFGLGDKGEAIAKNEYLRQQGKFDRVTGVGLAAAGAGGIIATKILKEKGVLSTEAAKKAYAASGVASVVGVLNAGLGTYTMKTAMKNISDVKSGKVDPRKTYNKYANLRND